MAPNPKLIFELATEFWRSSVMFAACDLNLFDALEEEKGSVSGVAARLEASERGMYGLLESCVAIGLLEKDGDVYRNTEAATAYLTSSSPESLLVTLKMQSATYPLWMKLADSVKTGKPAMPPKNILGGNKEMTRHFVVGMHQRAIGVAKSLVDAIDLSGCKMLADIGGGPGTYSVMLAQKNPELRSKVMDLPPILEVARELIDSSGIGERIATVPCNAEQDDFGNDFDAALISGILHRMTEDACRSIFKRVYKGLTSGGQIIVNDLFSDGDGPEMAVLFGLQMLLVNETGVTHKVSDISEWLKAEGFKDIRSKTLPQPLPHTIITGCK